MILRMAETAASASTQQQPQQKEQHLVLLYDGVCRLCNGVVKFVIARDPEKKFKFCALQSAAARPFLERAAIPANEALQSFVVVRRDGIAVRRSDAALTLGDELPWPWPLLSSLGWLVPRIIRDTVYSCVAASRYAVFGKAEDGECLVPSASVMSRMLDADELRASLKNSKKTK